MTIVCTLKSAEVVPFFSLKMSRKVIVTCVSSINFKLRSALRTSNNLFAIAKCNIYIFENGGLILR